MKQGGQSEPAGVPHARNSAGSIRMHAAGAILPAIAKAGDRSRTGDIQLGKQLGNPAGDTEKADSEHPPSTGPSSCAHEDTEVGFVCANWGRLPQSVQTGIIAMVRASL